MKTRCLLLAVVGLNAASASPAIAASQTVVVDPFGHAGHVFAPDRVAISPGESVTWSNPGSDEPHNVRFDVGSFKEPPDLSSKFTVSRSFSAAGTFRYYCENHGSPGGIGMAGVVYVNAEGALPPQAKFSVLTSPTVVGRPVTFDAGASSASIVKYEWDLNGNGLYGDPEDKTSTTPTTSHTYLLPQTVEVGLRVTDDRGATDAVTSRLTITSPPSDPAPVPPPDLAPPPGPAPGPPPPAPGPTPTTISSAPGANPSAFSFSASPTVKRARGAVVAVTCTGRCRFTATLSVSASVARKARLGRRAMTIGAARGTLGAAGTKQVTVKLTAKARLRTARLKSLRATLKLTVIDASGRTSRKAKSVTLRR